MNENDYKAIRQIIADLEKLNETANLSSVIDEINKLKKSIDERLLNVSICGLYQTKQNVEKRDVSKALGKINNSLIELKKKQSEIRDAINTLNSL